MKILIENPPNIELLRIAFGGISDKTVFTYGDTLYNPGNNFIDDALMAHEEVHAKQQTNPEEWWQRYLADVDFRLSQEVEAYQKQYRRLRVIVKDRNQLARLLHQLATDLSSDLYGGIINYNEAVQAIKSPIDIKFKL
jgi:hypothetical protein